MGTKILDQVVGWATVAVLTGVVGVGVVAGVNSANAEPEVAETPAAVITTDLTDIPYTNGLAGEQETDAAAAVKAEQDRLAAEAAAAEAARIAAEQAAAEQAAAEQATTEESNDEPTYSEPDPAPEAPVDYCPDGYIDDPNLGCHSPICAVLEDGTQVPCQH
jgi:hypothetical protein